METKYFGEFRDVYSKSSWRRVFKECEKYYYVYTDYLID